MTQGAGDPGFMYFGVETYSGCILAVRMHVERGCGGFMTKVWGPGEGPGLFGVAVFATIGGTSFSSV